MYHPYTTSICKCYVVSIRLIVNLIISPLDLFMQQAFAFSKLRTQERKKTFSRYISLRQWTSHKFFFLIAIVLCYWSCRFPVLHFFQPIFSFVSLHQLRFLHLVTPSSSHFPSVNSYSSGWDINFVHKFFLFSKIN